jgi:hypothetical protein
VNEFSPPPPSARCSQHPDARLWKEDDPFADRWKCSVCDPPRADAETVWWSAAESETAEQAARNPNEHGELALRSKGKDKGKDQGLRTKVRLATRLKTVGLRLLREKTRRRPTSKKSRASSTRWRLSQRRSRTGAPVC